MRVYIFESKPALSSSSQFLHGRRTLMPKRECGFSLLELLVVIIILGIIVAMPIPQALTAVKAYRLHADAAVVACDPAIDLSGVCVRL